MKTSPILKCLLVASLLSLGGIACAAVPMSALNPDVRAETIEQTICTHGYTRDVRPSTSYTNGVKFKLMREQGLDSSSSADYELDHIIPLALGGHPRSLSNLMLQPWEGKDSAKRKDRLEVKLQCLVCSGQVGLDEARQVIYEDWQGAYHRYAQTKCHRERQR